MKKIPATGRPSTSLPREFFSGSATLDRGCSIRFPRKKKRLLRLPSGRLQEQQVKSPAFRLPHGGL